VPEVQDESVPFPAATEQRARKRPSPAASLNPLPLATPPIEADRTIKTSTVVTPVAQSYVNSRNAGRREVEPRTTSTHAIASPARNAEPAQADAAVASNLEVQPPQQSRETHSVVAQSTHHSASQEHPLTPSQSRQPSAPRATTLLSESKPQTSLAAVRAAESKASPAPTSTRKAHTDPAPPPSSPASQPLLTSKPQTKPAQAEPPLLPLTARVKPATEAKPKERPAARVHIGKLEIRMTTPPQPMAPPAAAKPAQVQRLAPPAAATAPQPLTRELAWTYGLVQG
jgi:hypothetical protein